MIDEVDSDPPTYPSQTTHPPTHPPTQVWSELPNKAPWVSGPKPKEEEEEEGGRVGGL